MDLGCTPWMALTKVIVPQIMPGIVSGALIAFTMSFDDFIISYFVTGKGIKNLSIMVYTMSKRVNPSINAISTLVVVFITIVLIIVNVAPMVKEKEKHNQQKCKKKEGTKNYCSSGSSMCFHGTCLCSKNRNLFKNMQDKHYTFIMRESIQEKTCFLILKNKQDVKLLWIFLIQMNKCILK